MTCFHPIEAWRPRVSIDGSRDKRLIFSRYKAERSNWPYDPIQVACGQCIGCRLERSRVWAVRCIHEASLYPNNCFVTLTYDDASLPEFYNINSGLVYEHFQLFMKRLRERFVPKCPFPKGHESREEWLMMNRIRFYMCGEYGDDFSRPHFHALLFNFDFSDKYYWTNRNGNRYYRSSVLDGMPRYSIDRGQVSSEALWPYGNCEIGDVTFNSAAYVARYIMKKQTGSGSSEHYEWVDPSTGEIFLRRSEFNEMSTSPGIGKAWVDKFYKDVYPHDYLVVNGVKTRSPRYYDNIYSRLDPAMLDEVKHSRSLVSKNILDNNSAERLAVREQCVKVRTSQLKRTLT
jgi:hypothetical protein